MVAAVVASLGKSLGQYVHRPAAYELNAGRFNWQHWISSLLVLASSQPLDATSIVADQPSIEDRAGLGDEPRRVLSELSELQLVDVVLPRDTGKEIRTGCVTRPYEHQKILLDRLGLRLPSRLKSTEI